MTLLACSEPPEGRSKWTVRLLIDRLVEMEVVDSIWRMEDVLDLYEQPYDPKRPVICFDKRPCQLIGDAIIPIPIRPGSPKKEHYEYNLNTLSKQCLDRRIAEMKRLIDEVSAWEQKRNAVIATVRWRFNKDQVFIDRLQNVWQILKPFELRYVP